MRLKDRIDADQSRWESAKLVTETPTDEPRSGEEQHMLTLIRAAQVTKKKVLGTTFPESD